MQPMNYTINAGNPIASGIQGYQTGQAIQQQAVQQQQQQQMRADLTALAQKENPTATDFARATIKYPQLAEHFKNVWAPLNAEQQQNKMSSATQVYSALQSGSSDIAKSVLQPQLEAARNSGNAKEAAGIEALMKTIDLNPQAAMTSAGLLLASTMGPEKFASTFDTLQKSPNEAQKIGLENQRLGLEVGNLPTKQTLENQNLYEDAETKKLNRDISVLDAKIKSADSETKRDQLQLERDKLSNDLDTKKQDKQAAAQDSLDTISKSLEVLGRIEAHPTAQGGVGGVGSVWRPGMAKIAGSNAIDFDNLLETAQSQQFGTAIATMKGMGALSDAEGKRLEKAVASLSPDQSPESFKTAVKTIRDTLERSQAKIIGRQDLPKTTGTAAGGSAYVMTHPKYGVINDAVINKLLASKPGLTREQAIEFFRASGGK